LHIQGQQLSQLCLSNSHDDESGKNEGIFDVDSAVKNISFNLRGEVNTEIIDSMIYFPDGKFLKNYVLIHQPIFNVSRIPGSQRMRQGTMGNGPIISKLNKPQDLSF